MLENQFVKDEILLLNEVMNRFGSVPRKLFKNEKGKLQSSICMILRINPDIVLEKGLTLEPYKYDISQERDGFLTLVSKNSNVKISPEATSCLQILFVKRAVNPKDFHSGQTGLPGGKCDNDEDDYTAVLREIEEEVGLDVKDPKQYAYLGKFPINFGGYLTKKGDLRIAVHMLFQLSLNDTPIKKSAGEIEDIIWLPLRFFLNPDKSIVKPDLLVPMSYAARFPRQLNIKMALIRILQKDLETCSINYVKLPKGGGLWGITYVIITFFLSHAVQVIKFDPKSFPTIPPEPIHNLGEEMKRFDIIASKKSKLNIRPYLMSLVFYQLRVSQGYPSFSPFDAKIYLLMGLIALMPFGAYYLPRL